MTRSDPNDDSDLRDAHLLAALRHAPDREAAPPPAVSALILARARAATAPRSRWRSLLDALRRPHVAGAFATLAVATLVGVMWSAHEPPAPELSRPLRAPAPTLGKAEEYEKDEKAPVAKADAPAAQPVPEAATPPGAFSDAASFASTGAAATAARRDDAAKKSVPAPSSAPPRVRTQPSLVEPKEADVRRTAPAAMEQRSAAPMAPAPSIESAALPTPLPAPPTDEGARERRPLSDEAKASASGRVASSMPPTSAGMNLAARQESEAAAALAKQIRVVDDPLPRMQVLLAGADAAWTTARGKASPQGQAPREWWSRVRDATRGRWLRAEVAPPAVEPWLGLTQREQRVAALWIEPGVLILSDGTRVWRAALDDALLREWQEAVARW